MARKRARRRAGPPSRATYSGKDVTSGLDNGDGSEESGGRRGEKRVPESVELKISERVGEGGGDDDEDDEEAEDGLEELELPLGSLILGQSS